MKVFKVEFSIYNRTLWKRLNYKIHTETMEQMEESIKKIIVKSKGEIDQDFMDSKWESIKKDIVEEKLEFPLIDEH